MTDKPKNIPFSNFNMQEINECFKSDRSFHTVLSNTTEFKRLLSNIGDMPFEERSIIAKHILRIVEGNPRLIQDNSVFQGIIQISKNIPQNSKDFQECAGKIMLKVREALIKNRTALSLNNELMAEYSETIREFLTLIPTKPKTSFLNSFETDIYDFITGKLTKEQRDERLSKNELNQKAFDDDDDDIAVIESKMQKLMKMMFSDVIRLDPGLVSAVILSLVTKLPHGNLIIEDTQMKKDLMHKLNV